MIVKISGEVAIMRAELAQAWQEFKEAFKLSESQVTQFQAYSNLLQTWNERMNLTAIKQEAEILQDHFADSLALINCIDLKQVHSLLDVGAGAGFPSLPLALACPWISALLLEVIAKKRLFLNKVACELKLTNVAISELDFRTYIRSGLAPVDLVVARASLGVDELVRIFSPASTLNGVLLVYWASEQWTPSRNSQRFIIAEKTYIIGKKKRKLVFMSASGKHSLVA